jgi:DNA-binding transcriptional LysR family regulator
MTLDAYRVFHEVARSGSVTRAAERLFLSQPAVSKAIRLLEERLGFTLFVRRAKGVELTAEGAALFRHVDTAMTSLQAGERLAERFRNLEEGIVRVGISHTLCRHWFLPYLRRFHDDHPQLRIQVLNRTSPETMDMLRAGTLDFGIVSRPENIGPLQFEPLLQIEDIFVTNNRAQVPVQPVPLREIAEYPLMMLEPENTSRQQLERHFAAQGIPLKAEIEISSMDFLIEFAKIGLGIAAVVRSFVAEELARGELFEIPVEPPPGERWVGVLRNPEWPLSRVAEALIHAIR